MLLMSRFSHLSRRKHHPWVCSTSCCIHRCICCVRIILSCCYCSCLKQSKSEIRCLQFAHLCCCILFGGEEQVHDHGGSNKGTRSLHWGLDRVLFIFYSSVFPVLVCASLGVFITLSWQSNVLQELFFWKFFARIPPNSSSNSVGRTQASMQCWLAIGQRVRRSWSWQDGGGGCVTQQDFSAFSFVFRESNNNNLGSFNRQ